jgi:hypothetical protein
MAMLLLMRIPFRSRTQNPYNADICLLTSLA